MSEYELTSLFQTQINTIGAELMDYFTILTAFPVAGYVASHRLTLSMALFVTVMFAVSALFFVVNVVGSYAATKLIMTEMHTLAEAGKGFRWTLAAQQSPTSADVFADIALVMMLSGIVGGVYFFFQSRYHNRQTAPA